MAKRRDRLGLLLAAIAFAVGGSVLGYAFTGSSSASTTSARGSTTSNPASTPTPVGSTEPSSPATAGPPTTSTRQSFNTLFDFANGSVTDKLAVVEDGDTLRQAMTGAVSTPFVKAATGVKVETSTVLTAPACAAASLPAPCALVTYDVVAAGGAVILPNSQGYAVSINGQWLVSKSTVCNLFELFYQASGRTGIPAGC